MIGKLRGIIDSTDDDTLIIDVNGVGYSVFCSGRTAAALTPGSAAELIIETHVREDHFHLYGFANTLERDWFRTLATVQGVGNKTALAILSAYTPDQMSRAILAKDISAFKAISGIGPKLAERIVVELKDKVLKLPTSGVEMPLAGGKKPTAKVATAADDAISALVNLGYSRTEAYSAALKASEKLGDKASVSELIKASLQEMARK
jgi:Holliday junction DNA helicase RuvA